MKYIIRIGGLSGILISLAVMLTAIVDDSWTLGNFGILAILGSILGIVGSYKTQNNGNGDGLLIISGTALGIYGVWIFYIVPATLMLLPYSWILYKKNKFRTS